MNVFEKVKQLASEKGYSLLALNDKAKLGKNAIYKWKTQQPSTENLKKVADVLGVSVDYLLGNTDEMHPSSPSAKKRPVDLDEALSDEGMAMFDGQPLSEEYKKALLTMLRANRNGEY